LEVLYCPLLKLREIAERLDCRLQGDGEIEIRRVAAIEDAAEGDLTFFANPKYHAELTRTRVSRDRSQLPNYWVVRLTDEAGKHLVTLDSHAHTDAAARETAGFLSGAGLRLNEAVPSTNRPRGR